MTCKNCRHWEPLKHYERKKGECKRVKTQSRKMVTGENFECDDFISRHEDINVDIKRT